MSEPNTAKVIDGPDGPDTCEACGELFAAPAPRYCQDCWAGAFDEPEGEPFNRTFTADDVREWADRALLLGRITASVADAFLKCAADLENN